MTDEAEVVTRHGREGGRWVNERPTSEEFAEWFTTSMKLDPELRHEDYIGGVVLIPAVDSKAKQVIGFSSKGHPIIEDRPELSYVPYAKVEARTAYYWDLLDAHPEWIGIVQPVDLPRVPIDQVTLTEVETTTEGSTETVIDRSKVQPGGLATMVHQLPEGFSVLSVPVKDGYTHFLCATIRVSIYLRAQVEAALDKVEASDPREALTLALARCVALRTGRGTKQVPFLTGYRDNPWADPSLLMKAETGALGRALGFAGIFVIPGSGVATAEDMLEAIAQGAPPIDAAVPGNAGPDAPTEAPVRTGAEQAVDEETEWRARAGALYKALSESNPAKAEEFGRWTRERRLASLGDAKGAMLKGVVRKLEKLSDEAVEEPAPAVEEASDAVSSGPTG